MAHRLFHTLVFSSVMALEGLGCAFSHREPPPEPEPDPMDPLRPDAGWGDDADVPDSRTAPDATAASDATTPPDTGTGADAGADPDAATDPDTATAADSAAPSDTGTDTGPDPADLRLCEAGWPTTKASYCYTVDPSEMPPKVVCCNSTFTPDGGEACCLQGE